MHESSRLRNLRKIFSSPNIKPLSQNYQQYFEQDNADIEDETLVKEAKDTCSTKFVGDL